MKREINSNIVRAPINELEELGYKKIEISRDKKGNVNPPPEKSLLCLMNKEKDLWAELSQADIIHSKVNPEKFLILFKK
jgi:hypothetical protein